MLGDTIADKSRNCWVCSLVSAVVILLLCVLLPLSFTVVPYDQVGLEKGRVSTAYDFSQVYSPGRHYHAPSSFIETFDQTEQCSGFLETEGDPVLVYAEQGLMFELNVYYCWSIIPSEFASLRSLYGSNYANKIATVAGNVVRTVASNFTSLEYVRNRDTITYLLAQTLNQELIPYKVHVRPERVALQQIHFPPSLSQSYLQAALTLINNSVQLNLQQVTQIEWDTQLLVQSINLQGNSTVVQAYAEANVTVTNAQNQALQMQTNARNEAFGEAQVTLGLNASEMHRFIQLVGLLESQASLITYGDFTPILSNK